MRLGHISDILVTFLGQLTTWNLNAAIEYKCSTNSLYDQEQIWIIMSKTTSSNASRPGAGKGMGPGNAGGWPSTTGNVSGGDRSNNPPKK